MGGAYLLLGSLTLFINSFFKLKTLNRWGEPPFNIDGKNMLKSDQAACQFAHGSLLMARLLATRSRRTTSRKNNCVRDLRERWVSFTVLTDDRSPRIGCPVFQLLTDPPRLFPPAAGLFRLACASHVAFEGFLIPCSGFGGSSVSSLETSFLLSSGCLPS